MEEGFSRHLKQVLPKCLSWLSERNMQMSRIMYVASEIEGTVSHVHFSVSQMPSFRFSVFGVKEPLYGPRTLLTKVQIGDRIRAICVQDRDERLCLVDLYDENDQRLPEIYDRAYLESRLSVTRMYADPATIEMRPVLAKIKDLELDLIQYLTLHPDKMTEMHPDAFEKLVAEMMAAHGFLVEWTGRNARTAGDVVALRHEHPSGSFIVECKRYSPERPVGLEIARALYGAKTIEHYTNALLVTTSYFEKGVLKLAGRQWDFQLRDYEGLVKWLNSYHPRVDGQLHMDHSRLMPESDRQESRPD
jgi:hypothetical protein